MTPEIVKVTSKGFKKYPGNVLCILESPLKIAWEAENPGIQMLHWSDGRGKVRKRGL